MPSGFGHSTRKEIRTLNHYTLNIVALPLAYPGAPLVGFEPTAYTLGKCLSIR